MNNLSDVERVVRTTSTLIWIYYLEEIRRRSIG